MVTVIKVIWLLVTLIILHVVKTPLAASSSTFIEICNHYEPLWILEFTSFGMAFDSNISNPSGEALDHKGTPAGWWNGKGAMCHYLDLHLESVLSVHLAGFV
jgi:hypothetical protein